MRSTSFLLAIVLLGCHRDAAGGNGVDSGWDLALDGQNRIVVAGTSLNVAGDNSIVVWRYTLRAP